MKDTLWGPTLILNHVRAACAGVVWFFIMIFAGPPDVYPAQMLLLPVGYLIALLPMSLISAGLSKIGFPFIGWLPVILSLHTVARRPADLHHSQIRPATRSSKDIQLSQFHHDHFG